jgi:hypothetical protein
MESWIYAEYVGNVKAHREHSLRTMSALVCALVCDYLSRFEWAKVTTVGFGPPRCTTALGGLAPVRAVPH